MTDQRAGDVVTADGDTQGRWARYRGWYYRLEGGGVSGGPWWRLYVMDESRERKVGWMDQMIGNSYTVVHACSVRAAARYARRLIRRAIKNGQRETVRWP